MHDVRTLSRLPLVVHAIPRILRSLDAHLLDFRPRTELRGVKRFVVEFLYFGAKETRACLFVGLFFTAVFAVPRGGLLGISRYDLLLLIALAIQAWMLWAKLETVDEFKSICLFHVIGFVLEVFKTPPASNPGPTQNLPIQRFWAFRCFRASCMPQSAVM
jgi:uncharacterized membrane protein YoaT (DUF817 family)